MTDHRFVVPVSVVDPEEHGNLDVYRPADDLAVATDSTSRPVIVFVHGGPLPPGAAPDPRDSPIFRGYCSLAAASGAIGVLFHHRFHSGPDAAQAADDIAAAVQNARRLPGADRERVALWFFSGAGLLTTDWLRDPPEWLRCLAMSYPVFVPPPNWGIDERFRPIEALARAGALPLLLTRVGRENPMFAAGVETFVAAARRDDLPLDIIDVPDGRHAFDMMDDTDASREAVIGAMTWVVGKLGA